MRGGKFITVNNFSAQEHASSKNWHILNVTVMALCDITYVFAEKCKLISRFLAFLEGKVLGKELI